MGIEYDYSHAVAYNIPNTKNGRRRLAVWAHAENDQIEMNSCSNSFKIYL